MFTVMQIAESKFIVRKILIFVQYSLWIIFV